MPHWCRLRNPFTRDPFGRDPYDRRLWFQTGRSRLGCEPGFCYFSAHVLWKFCEDLRRLTFPPCKMTKKYCGDLRRRRIRAKTAQKNIKGLAREIPYSGPVGFQKLMLWFSSSPWGFELLRAYTFWGKCWFQYELRHEHMYLDMGSETLDVKFCESKSWEQTISSD